MITKKEIELLSPYIPKGIYTLLKKEKKVSLEKFLDTAFNFMDEESFFFLVKKVESILSVKLDNYTKVQKENKLFNLTEKEKGAESKNDSDFIKIAVKKDARENFSAEEKHKKESANGKSVDLKDKEVDTVKKNVISNESIGIDEI